MRKLLHVGCGPKSKKQTVHGFDTDGWQEIRLDIDATYEPDFVGTMTDLGSIKSGSIDAVFSSHNLEHLYPHEVPVALAEFRRVLNNGGFVVITCPDLQSVGALIAADRLTDPAYNTQAGPIAPIDILFGYRPALAEGNHHMAHRCGFTLKVLNKALEDAGFATIFAKRRPHPPYDLWAIATKTATGRTRIVDLSTNFFPA